MHFRGTGGSHKQAGFHSEILTKVFSNSGMNSGQGSRPRRPRSSNMPHSGGGGGARHGRPPRDSPRGGPDRPPAEACGVHANPQYAHALTSVLGCTVKVTTVTNKVFEGVLKSLSKDNNFVLGLVNPVNREDPRRIDPREVREELIFHGEQVASVTAANVDMEYATKGGFQTDSAITGRTNGSTAHKELQPWVGDDAANDHLVSLDEANGWDARDMFRMNERKYGVRSTYDQTMSGYTTPLERVSHDQHERAARIAHEIERSGTSRQRADAENGDEEGAFAAVARTGPDGRGDRYVPPARRPGREMRDTPPRGGPRGPPGGPGGPRGPRPGSAGGPPHQPPRQQQQHHGRPGSGRAPSRGREERTPEGPPQVHVGPANHAGPSSHGGPPAHVGPAGHGGPGPHVGPAPDQVGPAGPMGPIGPSESPGREQKPVAEAAAAAAASPPEPQQHNEGPAQPAVQSPRGSAKTLAGLKDFQENFVLSDEAQAAAQTSAPAAAPTAAPASAAAPAPATAPAPAVAAAAAAEKPEKSPDKLEETPTKEVPSPAPSTAAAPSNDSSSASTVSPAPVPAPAPAHEETNKLADSLSKSKLNPNAKEFTLNPNAKSFTPFTPPAAPISVGHTPEPPRAMTPQTAPLAPGPLSLISSPGHPPAFSYIVPGPQSFPVPHQMPHQPPRPHKQRGGEYPLSGVAHRAEASPIQVAAVTGPPLMATSPLAGHAPGQHVSVPLPQNSMVAPHGYPAPGQQLFFRMMPTSHPPMYQQQQPQPPPAQQQPQPPQQHPQPLPAAPGGYDGQPGPPPAPHPTLTYGMVPQPPGGAGPGGGQGPGGQAGGPGGPGGPAGGGPGLMYQITQGGAPVPYPPSSVYLVPGQPGQQMAPQFMMAQPQPPGQATPTSAQLPMGVPLPPQPYYFQQAAGHHPGQQPQPPQQQQQQQQQPQQAYGPGAGHPLPLVPHMTP